MFPPKAKVGIMSTSARHLDFALKDPHHRKTNQNSALDPWIFPLSVLTANQQGTLNPLRNNLMDR